MGANKIPARLKLARETFDSHETFFEEQLKKVKVIPTAPADIAQDPHAEQLYYLIFTNLNAIGLLYEVGVHQLERYVRYLMLHDKLLEKALMEPIIKQTVIRKDESYEVEKTSPYLAALVRIDSILRKYEELFLLTPKAAASFGYHLSKYKSDIIGTPGRESENEDDPFNLKG